MIVDPCMHAWIRFTDLKVASLIAYTQTDPHGLRHPLPHTMTNRNSTGIMTISLKMFSDSHKLF